MLRNTKYVPVVALYAFAASGSKYAVQGQSLSLDLESKELKDLFDKKDDFFESAFDMDKELDFSDDPFFNSTEMSFGEISSDIDTLSDLKTDSDSSKNQT